MGFDIVLIVVIVGGIALSAAYVRAEYLGWREHGAAERRKEAALRELHAASITVQHKALLLASVTQLQGRSAGEAAIPGTAAEIAGRRASVPTHLPRGYPLTNPRKRSRERVTQ
jgi:hypothetical protein